MSQFAHMVKILCLGNEFLKEDSLAKEIGKLLEKKGYNITNIKDSFELLNYLQENKELIIIDVVKDLKKVKFLTIKDLKEASILTAHDLDANFFLKLINTKVRIIGLPQTGDINKITKQIHNHLTLKK